MAAHTFPMALNWVWKPGYDNPRDGYHVTPGDPGGGTFGGVTEATWSSAVRAGLVRGALSNASLEDLSEVLKALYWDPHCDALPDGLDLLIFNGMMMTGHYGHIVQQCLGFAGVAVDGVLGPASVLRLHASDAPTLIAAITGVHLAYLAGLSTWPRFGAGWTKRILDAAVTARDMVAPPVS